MTNFYTNLEQKLSSLRQEGLFKPEHVISSQQQANIVVNAGKSVINLCSNNYLGLANHPVLLEAAKLAIDQYGFGMASVRFICGTQTEHKQLEAQLAAFLHMEDVILYSSCFDANGGLFETILEQEDVIISDALNHASIIDGIRLCKAKRLVYANNNMAELEQHLQATQDSRYRLIVTDGVFSMDGIIANLPEICRLAARYNALVMVDDSHAVGFMGDHGRGTPEYWQVTDKIDIITGTLGKALGGASGGYTAGKKVVIDWLRQRSRPYLFSNTLAPVVAATSLKVLELLTNMPELRQTLMQHTKYFRQAMQAAGFDIVPGEHPIIPVMIYDAALAQQMAALLLDEGIYVTAFSFPVVPKGRARIRTQMSAALTTAHLERAVAAFIKVGKKLNIIQ